MYAIGSILKKSSKSRSEVETTGMVVGYTYCTDIAHIDRSLEHVVLFYNGDGSFTLERGKTSAIAKDYDCVGFCDIREFMRKSDCLNACMTEMELYRGRVESNLEDITSAQRSVREEMNKLLD